MNVDFDIQTKESKAKPKNPLAGAVDIAIRDAEIYNTKLAIKTNGEIEHVHPRVLKRRLNRP